MRPVYHVIVTEGVRTWLVGPYFTFKRAEGDAQAWEVEGRRTQVVPRISPEEYVKETLR